MNIEKLKWRISCYPALAIAILLLGILITDLGKQQNEHPIALYILTVVLPILVFITLWGLLLGLLELIHWIVRSIIRAVRRH